MQRLTARPVRKGAKQGVAQVRPALPTARESVSATATPTAPVQDPEVLRVSVPKDVNDATAFARVALGPAVQAATTIRHWSTRIPTGLTELVDELATQSKAASDGNLGRSEAMLMSQAHTLVAIFNNLARTAQGDRNNLAVFEPVLRLAFKAQSQSCAKLKTFAEIKYPTSVAFVRQANIANGPQRVNNDSAAQALPRAGEYQSAQSKLLEAHHGKRLDVGTASQTVSSDPAMATVGTCDRASDR